MDQQNGGHASAAFNQVTEADWKHQLIWSGTETAGLGQQRNNGYLEGALESSFRTLGLII
jgi:hypothetical protein